MLGININNIVITTSNLLKEQLVYLKMLYLKIMGIYKKILAKFPVCSRQFFFFIFLRFAICKMVNSESSLGIYKSVKISIRTVMKNPEMFKFVPDHLQTKRMCKTKIINCVIKLLTITFIH